VKKKGKLTLCEKTLFTSAHTASLFHHMLLMFAFVISGHGFRNATEAYNSQCWKQYALAHNYACNNSRRLTQPWLFESDLERGREEHIGSRMNNKRIMLAGDSLLWQTAVAVMCMIDSFNLSTRFIEFMTIQLEQHEVEQTLSALFSDGSVDFVVFSFGTWYNFDSFDRWEDAPSWLTSKLLDEECPQWSEWMRSISRSLHFQPDHMFDSLSQPLTMAWTRRDCSPAKLMLGARTYASDLRRLAYAIGNWTEKRKAVGASVPVFVWKDLAPQHCNGALDGQFSWAFRNSSVVSTIGDKVSAYKRNKIANHVLFRETQVFDGGLLRLWDISIDESESHVDEDCTHYCNPSRLTWRWAYALLSHVANLTT
jgi:hypothetical protein